MLKHRGFPGRLPGTDFQFTIRRANPRGVTPIKAFPRKARPGTKEHRIDAAFLHALWHHFGAEPFERGNLDGERLCRLFGREVIAAERGFDPQSYFAKLKINEQLARKNFPEAFGEVKNEQSVAKGLKKQARE